MYVCVDNPLVTVARGQPCLLCSEVQQHEVVLGLTLMKMLASDLAVSRGPASHSRSRSRNRSRNRSRSRSQDPPPVTGQTHPQQRLAKATVILTPVSFVPTTLTEAQKTEPVLAKRGRARADP